MLDGRNSVLEEECSILFPLHYLAFVDAKRLNLGLVRPDDSVPEVLLVVGLLGKLQPSLDVLWLQQRHVMSSTIMQPSPVELMSSGIP